MKRKLPSLLLADAGMIVCSGVWLGAALGEKIKVTPIAICPRYFWYPKDMLIRLSK